jgi:hypothetical protein
MNRNAQRLTAIGGTPPILNDVSVNVLPEVTACDADTIDSYALTPVGDVEIANDSRTDTAVTVWVREVGDGATGSVTCHIVTAAGREDDRTMTFYGRHE